MPSLVSTGFNIFSEVVAFLFATPRNLGTLGTVISASKIPTQYPSPLRCFAIVITSVYHAKPIDIGCKITKDHLINYNFLYIYLI